jgi:succinoglycan biosynthesis protein ExoA
MDEEISNPVFVRHEHIAMSSIELVHVAQEKVRSSEIAELPFVSVIMPIRNEERSISRVLDCLLAQDYPQDRLEILVADGMSTDNTRRVVSVAAAGDSRIRLLDNPQQIMASGFNLGLKAARGDIIMMMGGHTEVATNYVSIAASLLRKELADCVGGPINTVGETDVAQAISLAMSSRFGVGGSAFRCGCRERRYVDTVAFGAYARNIMERAGPLDEEFVRNQDDEFNYRMRKLGGKILIDPELRSWYTSRSSIRTLWRQYFQYGYWKVRVLQKHPRQMRLRQFVPAAFVLSLLLSLILAAVRPKIGNCMMLLEGGSYFLATLLVSMSLVGARRRWRLAPALAVSFPVLHFSYGAGFLVGLAKFSIRRRPREGA